MGIKKRLSKVAIDMKGHAIGELLIKLNLIIFHWDRRERIIHPGKDEPEQIYYVIRPRGITEGLLSSWFGVLELVGWAIGQGYIPFVDFSETNRKYCQYYVEREIQGTHNAWEYYFKQPSNIVKNEIYQKKNVILSGWTGTKNKMNKGKNYKDILKYASLICERDYITEIVDKKENELFSKQKVLGVFIRGTDYVSLKPKNHSVQPTIQQMLNKVGEVVKQFNIEKIYVVTEDKKYSEKFKELFGTMVFSIFEPNIEYKESKLLQEIHTDDPYERGLKYLIRILLLSRCKYLVCSNASGSLFAKVMRKNRPEYEYWFELGNY